MQPHDNTLYRDPKIQHVMARRSFLKTVGSGVGVAALLGADALQSVEAAVSNTIGLTPQQVAQDEAFWGEVQQSFSMSRSLINLDNAWTCPSPRVVTEALVRYIWDQEQVPAQQWVNESRRRKQTVRVALARLCGCDPAEIGIVHNATEALKTILYGIPLKPGDEVLTTTQDYGSMVRVLAHREQRDGIKLTRVAFPTPPESPDQLVEVFAQAITPKTRVILVSHIVYLTGQVFPVRQICDMAHKHDIEVVVDGAHSFGHLDFKIEDLGCDYFGTSLHKWLLAPKGTGMLYIPKDKIEKIPALTSGPSRRRNASMRKYESAGTLSAAPFLAIGEAVTYQNAIGAKRKEERLRYLKNHWAERLQDVPKIRLYTPLDPAMSGGIATVGIEGIHPMALRDYLWDRHRVQTASISDEGIEGLRISPNLYTTLPELDYFCELMEEVAAEGLPEPYKSMTFERREFR